MWIAVAMSAAGCAPGPPAAIALRLIAAEPLEADPGEWMYALRFYDPAGDTVDAYLRGPAGARDADRDIYGILLIAGRETGREAAAMVPGPLNGLVLGVEYLQQIPEELALATLLGRPLSIRHAARRMPGVLLGMADFLIDHPAVDPGRMALVGVSFGVPFAAPAGRDRRFQGVALLYGGADLALLFRTHLPIRNTVLRRFAARVLASVFRDLEPARHVGHISPTPLLLINGLRDDFVPQRSALRLTQAAEPPVRHVWLDRGHLMPWPEYFPLMRELADSTLRHFDFLQEG